MFKTGRIQPDRLGSSASRPGWFNRLVGRRLSAHGRRTVYFQAQAVPGSQRLLVERMSIAGEDDHAFDLLNAGQQALVIVQAHFLVIGGTFAPRLRQIGRIKVETGRFAIVRL